MSFYNWIPKDPSPSWMVHEDGYDDDDVLSRMSTSSSISTIMTLKMSESTKPLREKNGQLDLDSIVTATHQGEKSGKNGKNAGKYVHVPHRDKPPLVVAKRNARERRRVQAVNGAFVRLRKAVPFDNNRGKRISKVKTLQYAIDYIQNLQELLNDYNCQDMHYYDYYQPETAPQSHARFNFESSLGECPDEDDFDIHAITNDY